MHRNNQCNVATATLYKSFFFCVNQTRIPESIVRYLLVVSLFVGENILMCVLKHINVKGGFKAMLPMFLYTHNWFILA